MTDNGLTWTTEKRKLSDLQPQEDNPRQIREKQVERLVTSWTDYGQVETLAIGPNGEIYNGHQRYHVMLDKFGPDYEMVCRVSSRPLTHKEWQRLTVLLHEGATGEWNFDELANWDVEVGELVKWGFTEEKLGLAGWDFDDEPPPIRATLAERFVVPPFSVLDARQGYWQERKRAWIALGIQSELGRGEVPKTTGGGSVMPACDYGTTGDRTMGNSQEKAKVRRGYGRCFGQDLMRGEHVVRRDG